MNLKKTLLAAAFALCAGISGAADDASIAKLNEELKELRQENPTIQLQSVVNTINTLIENHKKEVEALQKQVDELSADLGKKNKGRYTMKEEAALLWECIFGGMAGNSNGYYNSSGKCLTKTEYERLASCCIRSVQKLQEKLPKFTDYQDVKGAIYIRCSED